MPLLTPTETVKRKQTRVNLSEALLDKIDKYCEWSNIKKPDEFLEKAVEFVFSKDKEWQKHEAAQMPVAE